MNKGLLLFGHPVHLQVVHYPMALLSTSLLWDGLGMFDNSEPWWAISFWSIALGLVMAGIAAVSGMMDYLALPPKDPAEQTGLRHMMIMLTAVCFYGGSMLIRGGSSPVQGFKGWVCLGLEGLGCLLLLTSGWLGGELVLRFGVGRRRSEPTT
jgi:uncharacterized membrane protein